MRSAAAPHAAVALAAVVATFSVTPAVAEPLAPETCDTLRSELAQLEAGPAAASAARGPDWGKANLSPEQMKLVQRLILVRESVGFRCRRALVQMETPPAPVDPEKVPLPERNPAPRPEAAAATPAQPAAEPAPAAATKHAEDASRPAVPEPERRPTPAKP